MAKDDYNYLVFKILTYLYGCYQRKFSFDKVAFYGKISDKVAEETLIDTLRFMTDEGLINGLVFVRVWGNEYILASDIGDMSITSAGIRYLLNNDIMQALKKSILEGAPSAILTLAKIVFA